MAAIDYSTVVNPTDPRDPLGRLMMGRRNMFDPKELDALIRWAGSANPITPYSSLLYDALRLIKDLRAENK